MARIEIYSSPLCGFCHAAKRLLTEKVIDFLQTKIKVVDKDRKAFEKELDKAAKKSKKK